LADESSSLVGEDFSWPDLDFLADLQDACKNISRGDNAAAETTRPTLNTPLKILPPATPPFNSSTVAPGLLTSNDRMTIKRGSASNLWFGTGILVQMYSLTASMLYLS
jgi:hypothetical protein